MTAAGLALGTVQWGLRYGVANRSGRPTVEAVGHMLELARGAGVRFIDTARAYGESERIIGEATGGDVHWTVVTKLSPDADTMPKAAASLDASRLALGRVRLDVVLLHRWTRRAEAWDHLRRERDSGRVGRIGASASCPDEGWEMLDAPDVSVIQVASSVFDQRLSRAGFFEQAASARKTVFVRSVFLQGAALLPPDELPPHLESLRETIELSREWAEQRGQSPAVPFLAYAATLPQAWVLFGCESASQLSNNLRDWVAAKTLSSDIHAVVASVPELSSTVLNPASWPN